MGWWLEDPFNDEKGLLVGINKYIFPPSRAQPRFPFRMFHVKFASHQVRQSSTETGSEVRSDQ